MSAPEGPEHWRETIRQLEVRIAALEEDNEALAEGHEDALLLGLVNEQIQKGEGDEILRLGLERVAVLRDVPFCACLDVRGEQATILQHYCPVSERPPRTDRLQLSPSVAERLAHDTVLLVGEECVGAGLDAAVGAPFPPAAVLLIPFTARALPSGAFLFAHDRSDQGPHPRGPSRHPGSGRPCHGVDAAVAGVRQAAAPGEAGGGPREAVRGLLAHAAARGPRARQAAGDESSRHTHRVGRCRADRAVGAEPRGQRQRCDAAGGAAGHSSRARE